MGELQPRGEAPENHAKKPHVSAATVLAIRARQLYPGRQIDLLRCGYSTVPGCSRGRCVAGGLPAV